MKLWKPLATLSLCLFICLFAFSEAPQRLQRFGTRILQGSPGDSGDSGDSGNILSSDDFHAIINYVFWGPVADCGVIILRMFRGTNFKFGRYSISYQAIHGGIMSVVVILSLIVSLSVQGGPDDANEAATNFHTTVGTIIMIIMFITAVTGGATYLTLRVYNKGVRPKIYNKIIHRLLGVIVYLIAKANIITGAIIYMNDTVLTITWIYIGLLFLVYLIIESTVIYAYYSANRPIRTNAKSTKNTKYKVTSDLVAAINQGESQASIRANFPDKKWLMLHNKIYDLTSFIHPGGNFVIEACIGREVGRYFYGNHALENSKQKAYKHSALTAFQMNKFFIGELTNYESILSLNLDGTEKENHHETAEAYSWKLADVVPISSTTSQFCFQNDKVKVKNFGKSLSWLGRHFQISFDHNISPARQYTTAMCLNKANIQFRQSLYTYFDQIIKDPTSNQKFSYDPSYLQDQMYLPFVIKKYDLSQTNLSKALHKTQPEQSGSKFRVEGPFGRGLELTTASTGSHCIICVGTGILPVIDFLCLFLWKTLYDLIKNKAGIEKAQQINVWNIPFDSYFNGMKLTFVGGFANESEFIGLDIVQKLAEINKKYGLDTFKAMVKGYNNDNMVPVTERFSKEFLEKQVGLTMERYYVVGSFQMNSQISKDLTQLGVARDKIMMV